MPKPLDPKFYSRRINPDTKAVTYWAIPIRDEPIYVTREDLCTFEREIDHLRCNARICLHHGVDAPLHDMIIMEWAQRYFPPHRHPTKSETLTPIKNHISVIIYHSISERSTSTYTLNPGVTFVVPPNTWHQVTTASPYSIYRETKQGPFNSTSDNEFMPQNRRPL